MDVTKLARTKGRIELGGAPQGYDAMIAADLARAHATGKAGGVTLFVARDGPRATQFADALAFFAPELTVRQLPSWDCLPYDRIGPSASVAAARTATLSDLARRAAGDDTPLILVATVPAVLQRVPPRSVLKAASFSAKVSDRVEVEART